MFTPLNQATDETNVGEKSQTADAANACRSDWRTQRKKDSTGKNDNAQMIMANTWHQRIPKGAIRWKMKKIAFLMGRRKTKASVENKESSDVDSPTRRNSSWSSMRNSSSEIEKDMTKMNTKGIARTSHFPLARVSRVLLLNMVLGREPIDGLDFIEIIAR